MEASKIRAGLEQRVSLEGRLRAKKLAELYTWHIQGLEEGCPRHDATAVLRGRDFAAEDLPALKVAVEKLGLMSGPGLSPQDAADLLDAFCAISFGPRAPKNIVSSG